ncbi:MAG: hypothetical protein ACE5G6_08235 [Terriglobia bacterium]
MRRLTAALLVALLLAAPLAAATEPGEDTEGGMKELIFKWLNFILVFGALGYLLRKPMKQFFADQRASIRGAIEEARQAQERSQARLREIEQRLARLDQEIEGMRKEAAHNAAAERERIRQAAQREAERILGTTRAEIDSAGRAARLELRAYAARLAVSLAGERLQRQLTPEIHAALFRASLAEFGNKDRRQ